MHAHHSNDPARALANGCLTSSQAGRGLLPRGAKGKSKPILSLSGIVRAEYSDHRVGCLLRLACEGVGTIPREVAQHREGGAHGRDRRKLIIYFLFA